MRFCTAINCIDGRTQIPVITYLQQRFNADNVDTVTEAAPNLILTSETEQAAIQSIFSRVEISIRAHHSVGIAIVGHHDCAGNPAGREEQIAQIISARQILADKFSDIEIIGLWVDENWQVHDVSLSQK
jgi:hypothetical protein